MTEVTRTRQLPPAGRVPLRRPLRHRMLATACAAVVIAGSAGVGGMLWQGHRSARQATVAAEQAKDQAARFTAVMTDPRRIEVDGRSTNGGSATVVAANGDAALVTRDLPALGAGKVYQIWLFDNKGVHSVNLQRKSSSQSLVPGVSVGARVAVSVEPAGGPGNRPRRPYST